MIYTCQQVLIMDHAFMVRVGLGMVRLRYGCSLYHRLSTVSTACAPTASGTHMTGSVWLAARSLHLHTWWHQWDSRWNSGGFGKALWSWADWISFVEQEVELPVRWMALVVTVLEFFHGVIFLPGNEIYFWNTIKLSQDFGTILFLR